MVEAKDNSDTPDRSYGVLISKTTYQSPSWRDVVEALRSKYHAEILLWDEGDTEVLRNKFGRHPPRYLALVLQPYECTPTKIKTIYHTVNPDLGEGSIWGIVTGYDGADALRMVAEPHPLTARRLLSGCWIGPDQFLEGVKYSETNQSEMWEKEAGGSVTRKTCPPDATETIVRELNSKNVDVMLTSGHSSSHDWSIGYAFQSGEFRSRRGQLYGRNLRGKEFLVNSPNPKVYLAAGNCRVGHLADQNSLALGWMHSGGARQVVAYGVDTWYGYVGWRTVDYWFGSQGQLTLAEACFAAQHACAFELNLRFQATSHPFMETLYEDSMSFFLRAQFAGIRDKDNLGLLWDKDAVVLYGDPAWEARVAPSCAPTWTQTLDIEKAGPGRYHFTFTFTTPSEVTLNRPVFGLLPWRVAGVTIDPEFKSLQVLVGSFYILWKIPGALKAGERRSFQFTATKLVNIQVNETLRETQRAQHQELEVYASPPSPDTSDPYAKPVGELSHKQVSEWEAWFERGKQLPSLEKQYIYFSEGFRKGERFHPWAWAGVGLVWFQKGNIEGAIDAFEKALALVPDLPGIAGQLQLAREKVGAPPSCDE